MGDSLHIIAVSYRMGVSTVSGIVRETCEAIWDALHELYMPVPSTSQWEDIAKGYRKC